MWASKGIDDGPSWKFRRRLFFIVVAISFIGIFGIMTGFFEPPEAVIETALWGFFVLIATVLGAYTAGATWEDINLHPPRKRSGRTSRSERSSYDDEYDYAI